LVLAKTVQTSSAQMITRNSSTPNGSKFVSTTTEQAAENQEEYFTICLSGYQNRFITLLKRTNPADASIHVHQMT
jgi:hypothetical protein